MDYELEKIANAICSDLKKRADEPSNLTEAVSGITRGLFAISVSIDKLSSRLKDISNDQGF